MQAILAYVLILLTVAVVAVLPQLVASPRRRSTAHPVAEPSDLPDQSVKFAPPAPALAEVD